MIASQAALTRSVVKLFTSTLQAVTEKKTTADNDDDNRLMSLGSSISIKDVIPTLLDPVVPTAVWTSQVRRTVFYELRIYVSPAALSFNSANIAVQLLSVFASTS